MREAARHRIIVVIIIMWLFICFCISYLFNEHCDNLDKENRETNSLRFQLAKTNWEKINNVSTTRLGMIEKKFNLF